MSECTCTNHMGTSKNRYTTRQQAVKQLCWHAKRAKGATFTIITCKSDNTIFHIISSKEAKTPNKMNHPHQPKTNTIRQNPTNTEQTTKTNT